MTTAAATKPKTETPEAGPTASRGYVAGSHTALVRAEHDKRRVELLARDEVLSHEIEARQAERDDINEALRLLSEPASNVVRLDREPGAA